jgi:signal transduction histidine kinase
VLVVDALVALAVAGVLMSLSMISLSAARQSAGWTVAVVSAFVVLHACLALRRTAPVLGYLIAGAAMIVVVLAPEAQVEHPVNGGIGAFPMLFLPSSLAFLPALYAVCARSGRREAVAAITAAVAGVVLASARASDQVVPPGYPPAVQYRVYLGLALLSSVSAAWGLGMSRAGQTARETARRQEATRAAVLGERARIARDMHDVVAHSLAVIVRQADGGALLAERAPGRAEQVLRTIAQVGRDALTDMRGMVAVMRDPEPADPAHAARSSLADLPALMDRVRGAGLEVDLTERGTRYDVGPVGELAAYHVLREALTNAVKHAGPGSQVAAILDWQPESLIVEVRDGGPGGSWPGTPPPVPGTGSGLGGLSERVAAVGGTLSAGPEKEGFVVRARLPRRGGVVGQP